MEHDLTREELFTLIAVGSAKLIETNTMSSIASQLLKSAVTKLAQIYGYDDGYIESYIVMGRLKRGIIKP